MPDPPIVVTGGSVTLEFDDTVLPKAGNGKHSNSNKKITRVEVTDGNGAMLFEKNFTNGKVTVKVDIGS